MTRLVFIRRGNGEALCDITLRGGDVIDIAVPEHQSPVRWEVVRGAVVVANLHWDRGVGVGRVRRPDRSPEASQGGVCLICNGADGPAAPVEGAVPEMGDLRREAGVDMHDVRGGQAKPKVTEEGDLIGAAVACEEGKGGVGAAVGGEIVG